MSEYVDLLTKRVRTALSPRGAPADFCRKTGISRSQVQLWFKEPVNPTVETLQKIADALGVPPWELLRPEGAQPRVERVEHHLAECYRRVAEDAGKRAQAPAPVQRAGDAAGGDLAQRIARLSPEGRSQLETALGSIERGLQVDAEKPAK